MLVEKFNQKWDFEHEYIYYDQWVEEQDTLKQWETEHQYDYNYEHYHDDYWYNLDADYDQAWYDYLEDQKYHFEDPDQDYGQEHHYRALMQQLNHEHPTLASECQSTNRHFWLSGYANFCPDCGEKLK